MVLSLFARFAATAALLTLMVCGCSRFSSQGPPEPHQAGAPLFKQGDSSVSRAVPWDVSPPVEPVRPVSWLEQGVTRVEPATMPAPVSRAYESTAPVYQYAGYDSWMPPAMSSQSGSPIMASPAYAESLISHNAEPEPYFDSLSLDSPSVLAGSPRHQGPGAWRQAGDDLWGDTNNYYCWENVRDFSAVLALGAVLANTSLDADFQDWYQDDVRSDGTDNFASFWKTFGEGQIFLPVFACMAVAGKMFDETRCGSVVGDFGWRTTRAYLVGAPPMLLMQYTLGGSRPGETSYGSKWRPFEDSNSVSGHAFMGAVPFITAARMSENRLAKGSLYACSAFTAWSRVNDDDHYLSQAILGWWMAYLTCRAVDRTELASCNFTFTPIADPNMVGMGVCYMR